MYVGRDRNSRWNTVFLNLGWSFRPPAWQQTVSHGTCPNSQRIQTIRTMMSLEVTPPFTFKVNAVLHSTTLDHVTGKLLWTAKNHPFTSFGRNFKLPKIWRWHYLFLVKNGKNVDVSNRFHVQSTNSECHIKTEAQKKVVTFTLRCFFTRYLQSEFQNGLSKCSKSEITSFPDKTCLK